MGRTFSPLSCSAERLPFKVADRHPLLSALKVSENRRVLDPVPGAASQQVLTAPRGALQGADTAVHCACLQTSLGRPVLGAGTTERGQIQIPERDSQLGRSHAQNLEGWKHSGHGVQGGPTQPSQASKASWMGVRSSQPREEGGQLSHTGSGWGWGAAGG